MTLINSIKAFTFLSAAVTLSEDDQWRALGALSLGSCIGGAFGMLLAALMSSAKTLPWQIYGFRFLVNMLGGVGFGTIALWAVSHWMAVAPGPFLTIGVGFCTGWLAVGIAKKAEPLVLRRLENIGTVPRPLPDDAPHIRIGEPPSNRSDSPTTKINL